MADFFSSCSTSPLICYVRSPLQKTTRTVACLLSFGEITGEEKKDWWAIIREYTPPTAMHFPASSLKELKRENTSKETLA